MKQYDNRYMAAYVSLGSSFGVLTLITRWVGPDTIFFSSELFVRYGPMGVLLYTFICAFAFVLFGLIAQSIRSRTTGILTVGDIVESRTQAIPGKIFVSVIAVSGLILLVLQSFIIHRMLAKFFTIPLPITLFLFMFLCFLYGGVWGMKGILKLEPLKLTIIFAAVIFIPVYVFIQQGIEPIYKGLRLYHPYLLYWKDYSSLAFLAVSLILVFGMILIDTATWQRTFLLKHNKVRSTFTLMGLIYSTIPLSIITMLMISLSKRGYEQAGDILFGIIDNLNTTAILALFITFCLIVATSTIGAKLNALTILIVRHLLSTREASDTVKYKYSFMTSGFITLAIYITGLFTTQVIYPMILFNGVIGATMLIPMLIIIYGKKPFKMLDVLGFFLALTIGFIVFFSGSLLNAIWISFILSAILLLLTYNMKNAVQT